MLKLYVLVAKMALIMMCTRNGSPPGCMPFAYAYALGDGIPFFWGPFFIVLKAHYKTKETK
ncbi:hypothetical protein AGMMS50276_24500 [Synergistales bacterium]|nr:hypothetical protein AGMMS50276_24500 [Synergistales bacterium]